MNINRRLEKEIQMLSHDPGPGISVWRESTSELRAQMTGPEDSPYEGGLFSLVLNIPDRYPFEPPRVRFVTPVYHPNIDSDGRICLDTLKMQPQGSWSPSVNINTLLITIRVLLAHPNADDGLVPDITDQYRRDIAAFNRDAAEHTKTHASQERIQGLEVAVGSHKESNAPTLQASTGATTVNQHGQDGSSVEDSSGSSSDSDSSDESASDTDQDDPANEDVASKRQKISN